MTVLSIVHDSSVLVSVAGILIAFKIWLKATTGVCKSNARLDGKTVIITGANTGIGLQTAKELANRGARIVMVCRDMAKAADAKETIIRETGNTNISLKHVDFCSLASVRSCANELISEEPCVHILVNNAGVVSGSFTKTEDGMDKLMQANHFGPFLLTNLLLGRIKSSSPARIINVSSETHRMAKLDLAHLDLGNTRSETVAYGNSKLCNILMANYLANKLNGTGVTVNSLTPGVVLTDIMRDVPAFLRIPWNTLTRLFCKNAAEGAQTSVFACVSSELVDVSGKYFMDCKLKDASPEALDMGKAKKLWELSEEAVKLKPEERHY